jgi:hypothetical protein
MATPAMVISNTGRYVIDIQGNSTQAGANLDCVASKVGILSGSSATKVAAWPAPQKLVQPIRETPGRLAHGGTYEKAMDRRKDYAFDEGSRPRFSQETDCI